MKFKELVSKLKEKSNEEGKPETTKNYASNTPGQPPVTFTPDTKYDGVALAKELNPSGGIIKQIAKATTNMDIDADGDVDAIDKKNDTIPDEVSGAEKKDKTLDMIKKGAKERAHTKKGVAYESVMLEKLTTDDDMGKWITDFQKSDAPQFAGKSAEERKKMAIAAKLAADKSAGKTEEVEEDTHHDSGWRKSSGERKDQFGNVVKNVAKHLAKKGAAENDPNRKLRSDEKRVNGQIKREEVQEGKDDREYGYEGEMAITQLKTIMRHADHMMGMLKPETDLPEWVQSKITLSTDYMQTAHDYMMSEMTEEVGQTGESVESLDEAADDKSVERLKQLVRFGLMDKSKLPLITRAMKSLDKGSVTNPQERSVLFDLVNELVGIVTGDDSTFAKIRMKVQTDKE